MPAAGPPAGSGLQGAWGGTAGVRFYVGRGIWTRQSLPQQDGIVHLDMGSEGAPGVRCSSPKPQSRGARGTFPQRTPMWSLHLRDPQGGRGWPGGKLRALGHPRPTPTPGPPPPHPRAPTPAPCPVSMQIHAESNRTQMFAFRPPGVSGAAETQSKAAGPRGSVTPGLSAVSAAHFLTGKTPAGPTVPAPGLSVAASSSLISRFFFSHKFGKKVTYLNSLSELREHVQCEPLAIPPEVLR